MHIRMTTMTKTITSVLFLTVQSRRCHDTSSIVRRTSQRTVSKRC